MPPASSTTSKDARIKQTDWPKDRGPLKTLAALGLHDISSRPGWARHMLTKQIATGTVYMAVPVYLNTDAIRQLAALTFEGYDVDISAGDHGDIALVIYDNSRKA